jgi:histidinol-phosphate phosphatase family protein
LTQNGYRIFVITNQAGIGRGIYPEESLRDIHCRMVTEIKEAGGTIDALYYCPHHPDAGCKCRKPRPGMLKRAAQEHNIDLSSACFIGDATTDIEAGKRAGTATFLVLTGLGRESYHDYINAKYYQRGNREKSRPDKIFTNLYTAARWLLKNDS